MMRSSSGMNVGQHVEQRGLAGAGAAGDEDIAAVPRTHASQHLRGRAGQRPDRRSRSSTVNGSWENLRIVGSTRRARVGGRTALTRRAVREPGVDHRGLTRRPAAHPRHDAIDVRRRCSSSEELQVGLVEPPAALDEDRVRAVHHDLRDLRVAQERLEGAVAQDVVDDLLADAGAVAGGERLLRLREHRLDGVEDALLEDAFVHLSGIRLLAQGLHEVVVHLVLEGGVLVVLESDARGRVGDRRDTSRLARLVETLGKTHR